MWALLGGNEALSIVIEVHAIIMLILICITYFVVCVKMLRERINFLKPSTCNITPHGL